MLADLVNSRQNIIERARPLLQRDEVVAHVVRASEGPGKVVAGLGAMAAAVVVGVLSRVPFLVFPLSAIFYTSLYPRRILLATDQALVLLAGTRWRWTPRRVLDRLDVDTPIGPLKGFFMHADVNGRRLWIVPRCVPEVKAADEDLQT